VNVHPAGVRRAVILHQPWSDAYDVVTEGQLSNVINPDDPNELDNNNYQGATNHGGAASTRTWTITALTPDATRRRVDRCHIFVDGN